MRKCPYCKRTIPVGIKKCIHCQMTLAESVQGGDEDYRDRQVGVSQPHSRMRAQLGERNVMGNEVPRQTMIGLPIASNDRAFGLHMRETNEQPMRTMSGMPAMVNHANPVREVESRRSFDIFGEEYQAESVQPQAAPEVPSHDGNSEVVSLSSLTELLENGGDDMENFPGVAPSSLIDEEFLDLTSKLFGEDFAEVSSDVNDEDGLEFDFVESSPEPVKSAEPVKAATVQSKTPQVRVAEAASSEDESQEGEENQEETDDAISETGSSGVDFVTLCVCGLGVAISAFWLLLSSMADEKSVVGILAVVIACLFDAVYFALRRKLSSLYLAIGFGVVSVILFVALVACSNLPATGVFCVILLLQLVSTLICILKKS